MTERLPIDGAELEVWSFGPGAARWDGATWGSGTWSTQAWYTSTCLITSAQASWGANRGLGILSVAAGGPVTINTYDPDRELDPTNASSPHAGAVTPGGQVRLRYLTTILAWAVVDEADYSTAEFRGRISGYDGVGLLANAQVTYPASPATTLRAFARQLLALTPYDGLLTVEADPADGDPTIGTYVTPPSGVVGVWAELTAAAQDVLRFAWVDPEGVIRFQSHGEPGDQELILGLGGIVGVVELITHSSADGIVNRVLTRDPASVTYTRESPDSQRRFGLKVLDRTTRKVPDAALWADRVLADRAFASLEYLPSEVIPSTAADLEALAAMAGVDRVRIRLDVPTPAVEVDIRAVGLQLEANPDGWLAAVVGYVSQVEFSGGVQPEPPEPNPEPPTTTTITRVSVSSKAARVARTPGGAEYGAGAELELPVGSVSGWKNRALIHCDVDWTNVVEVVSAVLRLQTSTQVNLPFGSSPKVRVRRITTAWNEGSASSPSSGNAVVWPGPSSTATGESIETIPDNEDVSTDLDVTAIVRAWAPTAAGGSGVTNRGFQLQSYSETADKYSTEFMSDDATSAKRPELRVTVKVPV